MFKKILVGIVAVIASIGFAFAQVDVNKADQAALDSIKGIGPTTAKKIIDERAKGGNFKDWADLEKRVKGIGAKNAVKFSQAGLTVNSQPLSGAPAGAAKGKTTAKDDQTVAPAAAVAVPASVGRTMATGAPLPAKDAKSKTEDRPGVAAPAKK